MRLFTQTIAFALALRAAAVVATTAATCKMLADKDSPFISSVAQLNGVSPEQLTAMQLEEVLAPVDENFPWFSKCVANVNLVDVVMAMSTSTEVRQCIQALEASSDLAFPPDVAFSDAFFSDDFCPIVVDTAVPCLNDVFLPVLAQALSSAGGCCSDMNAVITASFGSNLQHLTTTLSKLVTNAICSVKSTINSVDVGETSETCGYSLISNLIGQASSDMELVMSLVAAVQIPEESVCAAVEGEQFRTTTGGYDEFAVLPGGEPYGICYATMQNLVSYVKSFPIWSTLVVKTDVSPWVQKLSDLFASGTCVRGDYLLEWMLDEDSVAMKAVNLLDDLGAAMSIYPEDPTGLSSDDGEVPVGDSESGSEGEEEWIGTSSFNSSSSESFDGSEDESSSVGGSSSARAGPVASNSFSDSTDGSVNSTASASESASEEEEEEPSTSAPVASDASGSAAVSVSVVSFLESQAVSPDALVAGEDDASTTNDGSYSTASFIRESLSTFVKPLAAVCIHFPSVKACEFGEDELAFAFSDVGSVMTTVKTSAVSTATDTSTTKTTTAAAVTTTKSTIPALTTDAPESVTTGDASAAETAARQTGPAVLVALALAAAELA